ncbi:hypothetical protein [Novosphingobium guangzhouense]|uniref:Uncharacterized protein n=1 Tax=Novosphingobium guangzhouense TaxID=1850347 RepID=A0A2K2FZD0_9SPHN|nr:hypothetical protein [Novosphingobium guangzhouense]PNU04133.1 hypothetical protein A8V01_05940 [Novosphingobium guangzhouense]
MRNIAVPRSPGALTAIAAVLALSAIPAFAQEMEPPQDNASAQAAPPAVTPTLTLPPESIAPTNVLSGSETTAGTSPQPSSPTTQQTVLLPDVPPPATPSEAAAPARSGPSQAAAPRAEAGPTMAPEQTLAAQPNVPTAQNSGSSANGALAQGSVPPAAPAPARDVSAPTAQPSVAPAPVASTADRFPIAEVAGILAALGVAALGIFAMRRRRSEPVYEEADYPPPSLEPARTPAAAAEAAVPVVREPSHATSATAGNSATAILAASPLPQSPEERYELLDAMAAAAPDEGNPFTSRKGRLRRARLQLQHREHEEASGRTRPFDFRTYRPTVKDAVSSEPAARRETAEV